jgi:hypothetical protein
MVQSDHASEPIPRRLLTACFRKASPSGQCIAFAASYLFDQTSPSPAPSYYCIIVMYLDRRIRSDSFLTQICPMTRADVVRVLPLTLRTHMAATQMRLDAAGGLTYALDATLKHATTSYRRRLTYALGTILKHATISYRCRLTYTLDATLKHAMTSYRCRSSNTDR